MQSGLGFLLQAPLPAAACGSVGSSWVQRCPPPRPAAAASARWSLPPPSPLRRCQHLSLPARMMAPPPPTPDNVGVLFLCLGNICRSPAAEGLFRSLLAAAPSPPLPIVVDSCGTGGGSPTWYTPGGASYHEGDSPDARMAAAAASRGVALTSRSRPLAPADFSTFDWIVVMDGANEREVARAAGAWGVSTAACRARVVRMLDFVPGGAAGRGVPDPYYGGSSGFEKVLDLLASAGGGLLEQAQALAAERAAERVGGQA